MNRGSVLLIGLVGCYVPSKKVTLQLTLPAELAGAANQVSVRPAIAEARRVTSRGGLALELKRQAGKVRLELPGACPLVVDTRTLADSSELAFAPLFDVGPSERVVGVGQRFEVQALPRCSEAAALRTTFSQVSGATLVDVRSDARAFSARSATTPPAKSGRLGIVPVSARDARELRSELTFRVELGDGRRHERTLGVSAVARSSGLPNVGLHHPVLLSGDDWSLVGRPEDSQTTLRRAGELLELVPDKPGHYRLLGADGRKLSVQSGRFDQTPLDCGRSDCHAEISRSAQASPMTQALAADLGGCHSLSQPECASACHATGELGLADGGFTHVMAELGLGTLPTEYDELPRALRRLGGVGCMACHGPSQIPEPEARFSVLRNDVCAVCHDAPPRYGHVLALESSRMSHSDSSPETRREPCARCHTSWGALGRAAPPANAAAGGISCATCHDVHPHGPAPTTSSSPEAPSHGGLLRTFAWPTTLVAPPPSFSGVSRVCVSCHAPSTDSLRPEASAAAIVAGQGGADPISGAPLTWPAPHAKDARACLSCHDSGPERLVLGKSHGFRVGDQACRRCHEQTPPRDGSLAKRARQLLERLDPEQAEGSLDKPWHSRYERLPVGTRQARALRNVLLVLEDPAADAHNPGYAKALLDAAEAGVAR